MIKVINSWVDVNDQHQNQCNRLMWESMWLINDEVYVNQFEPLTQLISRKLFLVEWVLIRYCKSMSFTLNMSQNEWDIFEWSRSLLLWLTCWVVSFEIGQCVDSRVAVRFYCEPLSLISWQATPESARLSCEKIYFYELQSFRANKSRKVWKRKRKFELDLDFVP